MESPCKNCDRKGCGAFHDECTAFQEFKKFKEKEKRKRYLYNDAVVISAEHEMRYREILKRGKKKR